MLWKTVDVDIYKHPKLAGLPSDSARYGWIVTLLEAKAQRHPGTFASDRHYREVVGRFGKFLPDYLAAQLLDLNEDGSLAVHGWTQHEGRVRQAKHRDKDVTPALPERDKDVTYSKSKSESKSEEKATKAVAVAKPRASDPRNEPRLTEAQLRSWDSFGPAWRAFKEAWLGRGLLFAPFGSPDGDDTSQRGLLFQVMDNRPTDIVRWVKEAPLPSAREVITYILEQWHEIREEAGVDDGEWEAEKLQDRRTASGSMTRLSDLVRKPA